MLQAAMDVLEPALDVCDRAFFTRGTAAHVGKSAEFEEALARDITITIPNMSNKTASWWEILIELGGVLFDIRHHGRLGARPWTKTNPLNQLAIDTILEYVGRRCPDVVIRSHNHKKGDTGDNYACRVMSTPAWQLATEYTYRNGYAAADIGGYIYICQKGYYEVTKKLYHPAPRKPLVISR